ncbi:ester cyclase [Archangium lansingense]|uniref:ester cyclase n=1 Tax=Archangium lansingense TaxID=2995310 RepID=UPI003B7976BA
MPALTQEFLNDFAHRYAAAWTKKQSASNPLRPLITEDVHWADPMLPQPGKGSSTAMMLLDGSFTAFPDLTCKVMDPPYLNPDGNSVMFHWQLSGTMLGPLPNGAQPTGKPMSIRGVDRWEFRDGRICHYQAFYDLSELLRQVGLSPPA